MDFTFWIILASNHGSTLKLFLMIDYNHRRRYSRKKKFILPVYNRLRTKKVSALSVYARPET